MGIHTTWYLAEEGHEVVLAEGEELDVLHDDHLVVVLGEDGALHCVGYLRGGSRVVFEIGSGTHGIRVNWLILLTCE